MARRLVAVLCAFCILPSPARAQDAGSSTLNGAVLDILGAPVPGATVVISAADGTTYRAQTDSSGTFSIRGVTQGRTTVTVEAPLFLTATQTVTLSDTAPKNLRIALRPAGISENIVVTAARVETRERDTPKSIDVLDRTDLERTVAADLTDALKKNAGVDVIQYSGALSGIGIRGFRPQTSGINKRSLLLVDGRPSGITNLATLMLDDVERIEVLKGAASSVYGSSAMGGVVNVITRQSRGKMTGTAQLGLGSFGSSNMTGRIGGNITRRIDVDAAGTWFDQRDDYRMGNGEIRPATKYETYDGSMRIGADIAHDWRLNGRVEAYRGRDIMTPGDLASGINSQGRKNLEQAANDVRLTGRAGRHDIAATWYRTAETGHIVNVTTTNPLDASYLPYLSFESDLHWNGAQLRDAWTWSSRNTLVIGIDYERVSSASRSYARTGDRIAPFSANSTKTTVGVYAEQATKWRDGRTILTLGGRLDHITTGTLATPLKSNFTPSEASFVVFNPSAGLSHALGRGLRTHVSAGRGFIPAEAIMLTGLTTTTVAGRQQIAQGNPDLRPERSVGFDAGIEWATPVSRADVTLFRTVVKDRFISNVVVSNPPPPAPIIVSVENGLDAHISGAELDAQRRLGAHIGLFANVTHFFDRKERLASGAEQDILNVAATTMRAGADLDYGRASARVLARFVRGRRDNDFNAPGFPIIDYDDFTVVDASGAYRLAIHQSVVLAVSNLFDRYYYEKLGFPLQGRAVTLSYRVGF